MLDGPNHSLSDKFVNEVTASGTASIDTILGMQDAGHNLRDMVAMEEVVQDIRGAFGLTPITR